MDSVGLDSVLQVKPKLDPWQQKLLMELKEKKSVDELLKMHSRFLQVSVTSALTRRLSIITHNYHLYNLYYYQKGPKSQTKLQFVYQVLSGLGVIRSLICSAWPQL